MSDQKDIDLIVTLRCTVTVTDYMPANLGIDTAIAEAKKRVYHYFNRIDAPFGVDITGLDGSELCELHNITSVEVELG